LSKEKVCAFSSEANSRGLKPTGYETAPDESGFKKLAIIGVPKGPFIIPAAIAEWDGPPRCQAIYD
jgi:hypothetical protein